MKKYLLLSSLGLILAHYASAQAEPYLDVTKMQVGMDTSANLFRSDYHHDRFRYPKNSEKGFDMMNFYPVITGKKAGTAYATTGQNLGSGPLQDITLEPSTDGMRWINISKVSISDINDHLTHFTDPGYVPADNIANWPAMGNTANNEPALIAPFVDVDADGVYDPLAGDYPDIRGTHALFEVYGDRTTGTEGLGLEVQCMMYVFDCPYDSALQNTVFVHYKIINKSTSTYTNCFAGVAGNIIAGNMGDDYVGTDVKRGMFYVYNGDTLDETSDTARVGYDSLMPVLGVMMLGGPYQDADETDNGFYLNDYSSAAADNGICYPGLGLNYGDGVPDNERMGLSRIRSYTIPNYGFSGMYASEVYQNMQVWADGSAMYYGGDAYPGDAGVSSTPSRFTYFDNSDPAYYATNGVSVATGWTESSAGNTPGNRAVFASTNEFTINPGEINEMDFAFIGAFDYTAYYQPLAGLPILQQRADSIRHYFNSNQLPCGAFSYAGVHEAKKPALNMSVYPNPVSSRLSVNVPGNKTSAYVIRDIYGKLLQSGNINGNTGSMDVAAFAEGIYVLSVNGAGAQKFVVQH